MSCIYKYKGKKYSEEQFKEYFINNKQEFVTSIAKNKDVMDSFKRKMEGIDFVFSQSPELASIGSKAQYLEYLSTIFKTSKVKDIVYHGTDATFEKFDKSELKENTETALSKIGFNFVNSRRIASKYGEIKYVILNISNPKEINIRDIEVPLEVRSHYESYYASKLKNVSEDGAILEFPDGQEEYVVFEPEQIHILSSKKDLEMFRNFINFTKSEYAKYGDIQLEQKLQDLKSNPEFQQAVKEAFEESEELQKVVNQSNNNAITPSDKIIFGHPQFLDKQQALDLYTDYIAKISTGLEINPMTGEYNDSVVNDVVYHGTNKVFDKFRLDAEKATISDRGIFFAPTRNQARNSGKNLIKAIININPKISDERIERISSKKESELLSEGFNGYIYSYNHSISSADDIVVFSPEQILIINGKDAIRGFKEFVNKETVKQDFNISTLSSPIFQNNISTETYNNEYRKVQEGLQSFTKNSKIPFTTITEESQIEDLSIQSPEFPKGYNDNSNGKRDAEANFNTIRQNTSISNDTLQVLEAIDNELSDPTGFIGKLYRKWGANRSMVLLDESEAGGLGFQYGNAVAFSVRGIFNELMFLKQGAYNTKYLKDRVLSMVSEELIHGVAQKHLTPEIINSIFKELSQEDINHIAGLYTINGNIKYQLNSNIIVNEYVRQVIQHLLEGKVTEESMVGFYKPLSKFKDLIRAILRDVLNIYTKNKDSIGSKTINQIILDIKSYSLQDGISFPQDVLKNSVNSNSQISNLNLNKEDNQERGVSLDDITLNTPEFTEDIEYDDNEDFSEINTNNENLNDIQNNPNLEQKFQDLIDNNIIFPICS